MAERRRKTTQQKDSGHVEGQDHITQALKIARASGCACWPRILVSHEFLQVFGLRRIMLQATLALFEGSRTAALTAADEIRKRWRLRDPCATYYLTRTLALLEQPSAIPMFRRSVEGGFYAYSVFAIDPWLDSLRADPEFREILRAAETGYRGAADAFVAAGGEQLLGSVQRD